MTPLLNRALFQLGLELKRLPTFDADDASLLYYRGLVELIADVPGDIVECGVGNGKSLFWLGLLTEGGKHARRIWGFDSFEGLPPAQPEDEKASKQAIRKVRAKKTTRSEAHLRWMILRYRLRPRRRISRRQLQQRFVFVKGLSPATFSTYADGPIALLHLNLHRYQAHRECLEYFEPKVADGGVVVCDRYRGFKSIGATRAVDDYYGGPPPGFRKSEHARGWFLVKRAS
jgi:O-methyltransferase